MTKDWNKYREKIIGLGDDSFKKSYYPELQKKIKELEQVNLNFRTIFDSTSEGILIHCLDGNHIVSNPVAKELFNITEEKISVLDKLTKTNIEKKQLISFWKEAYKGVHQNFEWKIKHEQTNIEIPLQMSVSTTIWNSNKVLVTVVRDFTERKKFEQELIEAKEKAKESDKLKSAFLANMSHEIRTPMNGIIGFSSLLVKENISDDKKEFYSKLIIDNSNQLLSIVNDILDISMIETNTIKLNFKDVNINILIDELLELFKFQNKNIELKAIKPLGEDKSVIYTDKGRLTQILTNLINNAFKFTKEGSIQFGYKLDNINFQFFVQDTGVGIPKEQQGKVFERFRQADMDYTRKYGGTGLGLSLSKRFVELLGGKIWLESEENVGSNFCFTIPYVSNTKIKPKPQLKERKENLNTKKILIAEDEEINFLLIKELLSNYGLEIIWAKNGIEAVDISLNNPEIELILMDIKMPEMNGFEATKLIKEKRPDLPIIAQTAYAMTDDVEKAKNAGCDEYISKPIIIDDLLALIAKFK